MATHAKDLHPARFDETAPGVVIVVDKGPFPTQQTVFVGGLEIVMPLDSPATVTADPDGTTTVTLTILPSSLEVITTEQLKERLIN